MTLVSSELASALHKKPREAVEQVRALARTQDAETVKAAPGSGKILELELPGGTKLVLIAGLWLLPGAQEPTAILVAAKADEQLAAELALAALHRELKATRWFIE